MRPALATGDVLMDDVRFNVSNFLSLNKPCLVIIHQINFINSGFHGVNINVRLSPLSADRL